jgi:hypothetical protein
MVMTTWKKPVQSAFDVRFDLHVQAVRQVVEAQIKVTDLEPRELTDLVKLIRSAVKFLFPIQPYREFSTVEAERNRRMAIESTVLLIMASSYSNLRKGYVTPDNVEPTAFDEYPKEAE